MAKVKITLDHKGMAKILSGSGVTGVTLRAGMTAASAVSPKAGYTVTTTTRRAEGGGLSPRTALDIILTGPHAREYEGKYGKLAKGARAAGLRMGRH